MSDAKQYQQEFDDLMRDLEANEQCAQHLRGVQNIQDLFDVGVKVGITQQQAWRTIEKDPSNPKAGLLALLDKVRTRSI